MSHAPQSTRQRRYLAVAGLTGMVAGALPMSLAQAAAPFGSEPLAQERVIALAQPLSGNRWNLIVLEQREPEPPCWRRNPNGSVLTYEMHLPESTCGRYLSSSAYSLRVAGEDLRQPWRLRVENSNGRLQLVASGSQGNPLVIGSGQAAGSALVELSLQNDWSFERRSFDGQSLGHLYLAHANPLPVLLAQARSGHAPLLAAPPLPPPPPPIAPEPQRATVASVRRTTNTTSSANRSRQAAAQPAPAPRATRTASTKAPTTRTAATRSPAPAAATAPQSRLARLESLRLGGARPAAQEAETADQSTGVIALQVVPYRP